MELSFVVIALGIISNMPLTIILCSTFCSFEKSATLDSDDSLDTMWICPECSVAYVEGATDMVGCDACDNWFHW